MSAIPKEQIGRYKVLSEIGEGGMGKVFLAEDSDLGRQVALKVLPEKFSVDSEGLDRFKQEARAASALNHPNIITVYEIGEAEGTNFIATEFIDGKTLRERMDGERLTFDEVLTVAIQTAEALAAAHDAGIVHRDIKPENIMIRPDGYVKILDFGLAKLAENSLPSSDSEDMTRKLVKTHPGVVMGTVSYMSPEQARGKDIDARSDVFSFGVVLYELLGGEQPFKGETMTDILAAIINSEPPPLSNLAPHLPKELLRIVGKTLKKRRDSRYHSTRDLLGDLRELHEELLLEAKLESTAVPDRADARETAPATPTSTDGNKDALLLTEFENLTGEGIFDQTLKTALAFSLSQSPFLDIFPDTKVRQTLGWMGRTGDEKITKELAYEICLRQGLKAFITGTISSIGTTFVITLEAINARSGESLGRQFEQVTSREEVLTALSKAATGLREQLGESLSSIQKYDIPVEFATTSSLEALEYFTLAYEQQNTGKTLEAIPFYKKALEYDPNFASVYSGLGVIYANTEQWKLASEMIEKAYELRHSVSENEKLRIVYFYHKLVTGEVDKAIDTLEVWRRTYPSHVVALVNLADSYERIGQSEKAVEVAHGAMRLDSNNAIAYMNLAESLLSLGRLEEFKEVCDKAKAKKLDGDYFHILPYMVAFIEGDQEEMVRHLAWFNGRQDEYLALDLLAATAAFKGQWRKAQEYSRKSVDQAVRGGAREVAAQFAAEQGIRIAFWRSGRGLPEPGGPQLSAVLRTQVNKALSFERSAVALSLSAIALAVGGLSEEANSLIGELRESRPKDTLINELWIPTVRAAMELQNKRPKDAIEVLEPAVRFEREGYFYQRYLRAFAFEGLGYEDDALREFTKILDNRTDAVLSSLYPLAQLGKARILKDKAEYEKFFELWKDADDDMPAMVAAKREYSEL